MSTALISKEEAVHRALALLGGAPDEELIHFVQQEYGQVVDPRFLPVFRASLRAKQITEQARAKAREATPASTPDGTGEKPSSPERLPQDLSILDAIRKT
jgi:hypothetical protein